MRRVGSPAVVMSARVRSTPMVNGQLGDNAPLIGAVENLVVSAYRELR